MRKVFARSGCLLAGAVLAAGLASANVIPDFSSVSGGGSLFTYSYGVSVDQFQYVVSGDQLCLSAIPGLTGTATAPTGWSATESTTMACPLNSGVTTPNVPGSVLYTYSGSTIPAGTAIGTFTFQDMLGNDTGTISFGASSVKVSDNAPTANQGEVAGPATLVPEPLTSALIGTGLIGLGLLRRRTTARA